MTRSILHLIRTLDPERGGPVEFVRRMAVVHAQAGVHVKILTLDRNDPDWLRDLPASVVECGPGRGLYGFDPLLSAKMTAAARSNTAMVVHGLWQFHGLCASNVSRKLGVPYFVFPHGMLDPWFRKSDRRKHLKKQAYWMLAERRILRGAREVLFTSDHEARSAAATFWPAADYRSRIVPLGVSCAPTDVEPLRAKFFKVFPHLRGHRFLLFLGRLHPKKGCDLLVRAMADLRPPLDLVLAGPSSDPAHDERLRRSA
ncbi:MAG TPA: glycosyltransferase, partial [Chthoniobacterales bacterium]